MPNHVHNTLTITGPRTRRDELVELMKSQSSSFDFNKIIPMPSSLAVTSGSRSDEAMLVAKFFDSGAKDELYAMTRWTHYAAFAGKPVQDLVDFIIAEDEKGRKFRLKYPDAGIDAGMTILEFGRLLLKNKAEHNAATWYEWCVTHWGTKWNAYHLGGVEHGDNETVYTFQTAWSDPRPIFEALLQKFPELKFKVWCGGEVDEEHGYAIGPLKKNDEE